MVHKGLVGEEIPTAVPHDVVSSQVGLQQPWEGELDIDSIPRVCP